MTSQSTINNNPVSQWLASIRDYFRFVNGRRLDQTAPVIPGAGKTIPFLIFFLGGVALLVVFADPELLAWVRAGEAQTDGIFAATTDLGKSNWILMLTAAVMIVMSFLRADRFRGKKYVIWHRIFLNFYFVFTTIAFSGLLALFFKNAIGRARPPFVEGAGVWQSIPFGDNFEFASFPSGHSTTAGALTIALMLLFPRFRLFFIFAGLWIAISRMVIGVHFPSDVFGGFAFGAMFTWIYARSFARKRLLFTFAGENGLTLRGEHMPRNLLAKARR